MKIFCDYPEVVKAALQENNKQLEFVSVASEADITMSKISFPVKIRILLDMLDSTRVYYINNVEIDFAANELHCNGKRAPLTEKEVDIINYLRKNSNGVSREEMLKKIWQYSPESSTATVETHIYRLKTKLVEISGKEMIQSRNGVYKLMS